MQHALQQILHTGRTPVALYCEEVIQNIAYYEKRGEFWTLAITSHHTNENVEDALNASPSLY